MRLTLTHLSLRLASLLRIRCRSSRPLCLPIYAGGAEQRQTELGAPKRRPARPDHGGGLAGPSRDEDEASGGGGQEAPRTCRE